MSFARRAILQNVTRAFRSAPRWARTISTTSVTTAEAVVEKVNVGDKVKMAAGFAAAGIAAASIQVGTSQAPECAPSQAKDHPTVVFVLGGPGAGKGTQCARIVEDYGFVHLSAGDLLRAHVKSGTKDGNMVADMIKNGQIVPSEVTVGLLRKAMKDSGKQHFLIDGFPRNQENRDAFEREMGYDCDFVLFYDCPEAVMETRLLGRNEGRTDDNIETIRKRFKVFVESSMPVVQHYESKGKVSRVIADRPQDEVYESTKVLFNKYLKETALAANKKLLTAIDSGDFATYNSLVDPSVTAFEPECHGHLVSGTDFHKFLFDVKKGSPSVATKSVISTPQVTLLGGGKTALITYNRLVQKEGQPCIMPPPSSGGAPKTPQPTWWHPAPPPPGPSGEASGGVTIIGPPTTSSSAETRIFEKVPLKGKYGGYEWKLVHFHRSEC